MERQENGKGEAVAAVAVGGRKWNHKRLVKYARDMEEELKKVQKREGDKEKEEGGGGGGGEAARGAEEGEGGERGVGKKVNREEIK